ncbi:MAG: CAP domain-containing protein, partial [Nitrososphaerales archaeon]
MEPFPEPKKRSWGAIFAAIIAVLLVVVVALLVLPSIFSIGTFLSRPGSTSTYVVSPVNQTGLNSSAGSSAVEITYPSDYAELQNYSLSIINENRTSSGLNPVTLSPIPSAQQHADSMLQSGYFSHWDTQGYKPYMRYSVLGGTGFVEENVAYEFTSLPEFTSTHSIERSISSLEWQ